MDTTTLEQRAREEGTPVIHGETATFVWRGRRPVSVAGDFLDWSGEPIPLKEVAPGLWTHTLKLPRDTYVEYAFQDARGRRVRDPLNERLTSNGFGDFNHYFHMPESQPTPLALRQRGVPRGTVTRHLVETHELCVGSQRAVHLYAPPTSEPCPLVVVFDGPDYLRRAKLPSIVDNLIAQGRIRPLALAMVANGGPARTVEYACSEATLAFLLDKVLPLARGELNLLDETREPGAHAVLGSSLGGLIALYTGLRAPHVFGRVLSQSGAFSVWNRDFVVFDLARSAPSRPLDVWLDCGHFEALVEGNERMLPVLRASGHRAEYREYHGGHNYSAWRDNVWRGLEWLFGTGPREG
ncbi:MAG TPA: alpha/beta hydrolase-fold protein [Archangium sp.]|uniref:alpha/beta hydrolase-fold protein n=1 Tax=Archangium sp. TaxID=1872627 RepID=UPI002E380815|nr:alpha/beta hydrolase-fold protein [Archangium sp.]HEX5746225.1 alpha/beta hydrolase-fold protein [Archangium sp.]